MKSTLSVALVVVCAFPIAGALSRLAVRPPPPRIADSREAPPATAEHAEASSTSSATATVRPMSPLQIERAIVERARVEVLRGVRYDASYQALLSYPRGDVPEDVGACTDLVVRALRAVDFDLQVLVHEDVVRAPEHYPFDDVGDASIDHRRVATLQAYFEHNTLSLGVDVREPWTFRPGDVVFYARHRCAPGFSCPARHVALVSDRLGPRGLPLVLQNGGPRAAESDALDQPVMVGHFRLPTSVLALRTAR